MKIICSKSSLQEGINIVQKAVSSKTTLQILEGILLEAKDTFKLTGNDLEIGIECYVAADIRNQGEIVLDSKMFGEIVRRLPDAEILIEVKENNMVIIECENSHFEVKGLPADGYPALPVIEKQNSLKIGESVLREMIKQTMFAISTDENRPTLTGSLFECMDGDFTIVSIDGFRMALRKDKITEYDNNFSVIIPGKTLSELNKILQPVANEVSIYTSQNQVLFDMGNCKLVSRVINGEFMNYKNVIPADYDTTVKVNVKELTLSFERASLVTMEEKKYPVKVTVNEDCIVISSNTERGAVREELKVETDGSRLEIGFNPKYFIDALKAVDDEFVNINFTTSIGPCILKPLEDVNYTYMILPVRIKND